MAKTAISSLPKRLSLPEAVRLLVDQLGWSKACVQSRLEKEIRRHSLREIVSCHPGGSEMPTDIESWRLIEWEDSIVIIEGSFSGSPPTLLPIEPLLDRDELCKVFGIRASKLANRGGRPTQHDWDAFWVEVCRRIEQDGIPDSRNHVVEVMLDWFSAQGDEAIDKRTIEKKISKLFEALNKN